VLTHRREKLVSSKVAISSTVYLYFCKPYFLSNKAQCERPRAVFRRVLNLPDNQIGEQNESPHRTRSRHDRSAVLGSSLISKRFPCSRKVAQRATRRHLDTRLIGSGAAGWQEVETVWRQSEGYQRLRRKRSFFLMVASADNTKIASTDRAARRNPRNRKRAA
jgi:hypothetical protein